MRNKIAIAFILSAVLSTAAFGQFVQATRARDRMDRSVKASEDREHDERLEKESILPAPRPAVMNVDVQMVLSKTEFKTFAEAKAAGATKIVDGEPLWMYLKFKTKLGDYVLTTRHPDDREKLRYTLYAEVAPRGDITALNQYSIRFSKDDLAANEFKINLAPGIFGRNKSIPVFLMNSSAAKTGVWNNEFRLTNTIAMPRGLSDNLATVPITLDFSGGLGKYKKMSGDYDSIVLRGTTDLAKMPVAGTFFNGTLTNVLTQKLAGEGIEPQKIYFSGDDWEEFASFGPPMQKSKRTFATFTYRRGDQCFYGVATVTESFDFMQAKYGDPEIELQKDLTIDCAQVN